MQHWPHSWGQQQRCTCQGTEQINTLGTVKKFNSVHGAQEPHTRMDAGTSQEVVFHKAAFLPQARSQKSKTTVHNIFLTFF